MYRTITLFLLVLLVTACSPAAPVRETDSLPVIQDSESDTVTKQNINGDLIIYSGRSEPLIQPVLDSFKAMYPEVNILLKAGSNSELANALIEERANTQADIFITTELFTAQSLTQQGVFQSYLPVGSDMIDSDFIGPDNTWIGLTRRARVIMYNTDLVSPEDLPTSIFDLTDPKWKGKIAAAGSTNGSMQAQIAAMRLILGDAETEAWIRGLIANEITFFGGHTDVRKAVGAGEFALGLVNHYYYYLQRAEGSPVGIILPDQGDEQIGLITNATAAGIVKGASNLRAAQAFMDFLLSNDGQKLFAEQNYEYPLLPGVGLHSDVQPLAGFRLVDGNIAAAALEFEATFELIEKLGMP